MHQKKGCVKKKKLGGKKKDNRMKESSKNRLTDRCLEVDKGTPHQVGRGRLWFPNSPLKGLTSDAAPHPLPPFIHPSLSPTFFPLRILSEQILFSTRPLKGPGSSHLPIQREREREMQEGKKKKSKKKSTKPVWRWGRRTLRRPVWGWKDRQNQEQEETVSTDGWALTTKTTD